LAAKLSAGEFGEDLGQERGRELVVELGKEQCMLRGKEPDKELPSFLAV
jgi:hypothetical protein